MKQIKDLRDIDYKDNAEGRLLFSALAILTGNPYPNKTPDEVIKIISDHADTFLPIVNEKNELTWESM